MANLSSDETLTAVLSYLWLLVLIPLFLTRDRRTPFITFHLKQGLALVVVWLILVVVQFPVMFALPGMFKMLFGFLMWVVWVAFSIGALVAWVKAIMGDTWSIPLVSVIAEKIPVE